jgi:hypothetical protein
MSGASGIPPVELETVGGLRRLFGRQPRENAYREVQNLLATTPIRQIGPMAVTTVLTKYKLDLADAKQQLTALYGMALRHFARDLELTAQELDDLRHLRNVLGLSDSDVRSAAADTYRQVLKATTADNHMSQEEKAHLAELEAKLRLPDDTVRAIRQEEIGAVLQRAFDAAIADRRLSPDEERELDALKANLEATVTLDAAGSVALDHFRLLWRLDQDELPELQVPILLKRGEACHLFATALHHEIRTVTRSVRYGGPQATVRIARGLHYRVGQVSLERVREGVLKLLDEGTLYLTNKRLLFDGSRKSVSINLSKIIAFEPYSDGLVIQKDSGKDQFFQMTGLDSLKIEIAAAVLAAALRRDRSPQVSKAPLANDLAEVPIRPPTRRS